MPLYPYYLYYLYCPVTPTIPTTPLPLIPLILLILLQKCRLGFQVLLVPLTWKTILQRRVSVEGVGGAEGHLFNFPHPFFHAWRLFNAFIQLFINFILQLCVREGLKSTLSKKLGSGVQGQSNNLYQPYLNILRKSETMSNLRT